MKKEFAELVGKLETNPDMGIHLGRQCNKIRLSIASKGKGKSGGARVITHVYWEGDTVYLISIYDKSECESISDTDIANLLTRIRKPEM